MRLVWGIAAVLGLAGGALAATRGTAPPASAPPSCAGPVCATHMNGQTFVTWPDEATGASGNNWRYTMYRSLSPITVDNYASATVIADHIFNNSAQLFGGNPAVGGGSTFTQAHRQDPALPMSVLSYGGTPLAYGTGLQIYTALTTQEAYYAIVANPQPSGSDVFVGSDGPISESAASAPTPIKYADSLSRGGTYGKINVSPSGMMMILSAHPSSQAGGAPQECNFGDYWQWWLTPEDGYQDGRATTLTVLQDHQQNWPGQSNAMIMEPRDTWWAPTGAEGLQTYHAGVGMTPNSLVGSANRMYQSTAKGYKKFLNWAVSNYGVDSNQLHWQGTSMGAWGGANTGLRMTSPKLSSVWLKYPDWRMDKQGSGAWAGLTWGSTYPFKATVGTAPSTLGTTASSVLNSDGSTWGGTGNYADMPAFIAADPGTDIPFAGWSIAKNDNFVHWSDELAAKDAFATGKRGHVFAWDMGDHNVHADGAFNCDGVTPNTSVCYHKSAFKLNLSYPSFANSSIDDNPGDGGTTANGLFNGDYTGCINCGFNWTITTDTSGAWEASIGNSWMGLNPTASTAVTTTTTSSIASSGLGSFTVTDATVFASKVTNTYYLIDGVEVMQILSGGWSGNTATPAARGQLGSSASAHSSGVSIRQFISQPTGPNGGPYSSMTVDVTPRRLQNFHPAVSSTVNCTVTPHGGSPTSINPTVDANGLFTLTGFPINSSGVTTVSCS